MSSHDRDPAPRTVGWVIFVTLMVAYGYFHQGGGWNQNVRFDQVRSLDLHHGAEHGLIAQLEAALLILTDVSEDNDYAAVTLLGAFVNQVEAQHGKKISVADANDLISAADEILDSLKEGEK